MMPDQRRAITAVISPATWYILGYVAALAMVLGG